MPRQIIECVPNFSEGRDAAVINAIGNAIRGTAGARLLGWESDADHHRSVFTFIGEPDAVCEAAFRAAATAVERIDLNRHRGVHPRIGAVDVIPLVPLRNATLEDCAIWAHRLGHRLWTELSLPVYFYETAALRPERSRLEVVRQGGYEQLRSAAGLDPSRYPDVGGAALHPTAGAACVGARPFLLAFNVNLQTGDVEIAKRVARAIRASSGGLPNVKAIGVMLASRGIAQVSMNLTDYHVTPVHVVYDAVCHEALRHGVRVAGSELVGLWPADALAGAAAHWIRAENYSPRSVLEERILGDLLD